MKIKELRQQQADLVKKARQILDAATARGEDLTDDEEAAYLAVKADIERNQKALKLEEEQQERERSLATLPALPTNPSQIVVTRDVADRPWASFGEQLQAIAQAGMPGGVVDERLRRMGAATGASAGVASDAGYMIQHDFVAEIYKRTYDVSRLAQRCRKFTITTNADGLEIPYIDETSRATGSRWGGVRVYRRAEAQTVAASQIKIGKMEIRLEDLMGISYMTGRLLEDAPMMEALMKQAFAEEFAWVIDDEILTGVGGGEMLGILNSPAKVKVAKESGQSADTIVAQNIIKMFSRCWANSQPNAVWFYNQDIFPQLQIMTLSTGNNTTALVYMPPTGLSGAPYGTIYGRPAFPIEQCPTLGDEGDIILADLGQYILIDKGGFRSDQSMHVRFLYDEMAFRFMMRINGQPLWRTAVTAAKGTATYSPFVTLEAR